jgi:S-adenosylhomocysteine hydrolase
MAEHEVKDLSLTPAGKLKIERAEQSMPVRRQVGEGFAKEQPLKLASMDVQIDQLAPAQEEYLSSWSHGT